jgi:hypothetical protein
MAVSFSLPWLSELKNDAAPRIGSSSRSTGEVGSRRHRRFLNSILSDHDFSGTRECSQLLTSVPSLTRLHCSDTEASGVEDEEGASIVDFEWESHFTRVGPAFFESSASSAPAGAESAAAAPTHKRSAVPIFHRHPRTGALNALVVRDSSAAPPGGITDRAHARAVRRLKSRNHQLKALKAQATDTEASADEAAAQRDEKSSPSSASAAFKPRRTTRNVSQSVLLLQSNSRKERELKDLFSRVSGSLSGTSDTETSAAEGMRSSDEKVRIKPAASTSSAASAAAAAPIELEIKGAADAEEEEEDDAEQQPSYITVEGRCCGAVVGVEQQLTPLTSSR